MNRSLGSARQLAAFSFALLVVLLPAAPAGAAFRVELHGTEVVGTPDAAGTVLSVTGTRSVSGCHDWGDWDDDGEQEAHERICVPGLFLITPPKNLTNAELQPSSAADNCYQPDFGDPVLCQSITQVTANGGAGGEQLTVTHVEGVPGAAASVAMGDGSDTVFAAGTGNKSIDGGPGIDIFKPARVAPGDDANFGRGPQERWTIDLAAAQATAEPANGYSFQSSPIALTGFENVDLTLVNWLDPDWPEPFGAPAIGAEHVVRGNGVANVISATAGDEQLDGRGGDDTINAGDGDDTVRGGPGADTINCGPGTDTVVDPEPADTIAADCELTGTLVVDLDGGELGGDLFELDLLVGNTTDKDIGQLTYPGGGGLIFNAAPYPPAQRGQARLLAGPSPAPLPTTLAAEDSSEHAYLLEARQPGKLMIRAEGDGISDGIPISGDYVVEIEVSDRDRSAQLRKAMWTGAFAAFIQAQQDLWDRKARRFDRRVIRSLKKWGSRKDFRRAKKTSDVEAALAARGGLFENDLSWLKRGKTLYKMYRAYQKAEGRAMWKVAKRKAGNAWNFTVKTPFQFWVNQITASDPASRVDVWSEMYDAASDLGAGVDRTVDSLAYEGFRLLLDDAKWDEIYAFGQGIAASVERAGADFDEWKRREGRQFGRLLRRDPVRAAELMGEIRGKMKGELGFFAMEAALIPSPAQGAAWMKRLRSVINSSDLVPDMLKMNPRAALDELKAKAWPGPAKPPAGNVGPSAADLGASAADQAIMTRVVQQLNAKAASLGFPGVEVQMSFRPRNVHSVGIDGIGKNLAIKGKGGTDLDLLLGMHKSGLGKTVQYKPKLPKNLKAYDPQTQRLLELRHDEMLDAYRKWSSGADEARKALKPGGHTYTFDLNGATIKTIEMELDVTRKGGTEILHYRKLVVDGRTIHKGKPKPVISDFDGNALISAKGGAALPAGVRGALELEAQRLLTQAARQEGFAFGFHGWTHNGFDLPAAHYSGVVKYLLEHLPEAEAVILARKYGLDPIALFEKLQPGQYLIKVTRLGPSTGIGP